MSQIRGSDLKPSALRTVLACFVISVTVHILPLLSSAHAQDIPVELELVLLADASSSIRGAEFDLQVEGYASAFRDPGVIRAIQNLGSNGLAVTFIQWSGSFQQYIVLDWTHLRTAKDARAFAAQITAQARRFTGFGTATGSAMTFGATRFDNNGFSAPRHVIDVATDERSNQGPHPSGERPAILARGITINGLAILDGTFDLKRYFQHYIIGGPDAFVLSVETYDDFAKAIRLKLVSEISGIPLAGFSRSEHPLYAISGMPR